MMKPALMVLIAAAAFAQQPAIENAKLDTRAFAGSLSAQLAQFGAGPFWAGYTEPTAARRQRILPGVRRTTHPCGLKATPRSSSSCASKAGRWISFASPHRIAGWMAEGLPFHWIENVPADASVAWLKSQTAANHADQAIFAIAEHSGPAADRALDDLTAPARRRRFAKERPSGSAQHAARRESKC